MNKKVEYSDKEIELMRAVSKKDDELRRLNSIITTMKATIRRHQEHNKALMEKNQEQRLEITELRESVFHLRQLHEQRKRTDVVKYTDVVHKFQVAAAALLGVRENLSLLGCSLQTYLNTLEAQDGIPDILQYPEDLFLKDLRFNFPPNIGAPMPTLKHKRCSTCGGHLSMEKRVYPGANTEVSTYSCPRGCSNAFGNAAEMKEPEKDGNKT